MASQPTPDLIKVTEIFLVPSSFLVAALGTADTNVHRAMVSLLGLMVSALWWASSHEAMADYIVPAGETGSATGHTRRTRILCALPIIFVVGWLISTVAHVLLWNRPLGG